MSDVRDANTAPADSTKPAACGACGEVDGLSLRVMTGPGRVKVACPCGAEGPHVTTAEAPGDFMAMQRLAFDRWNRMWEPRAGEATAKIIRLLYCMSCVTVGGEHRRVGLAFEERTDDNRFNAWVGFGEIDAALAELGLAGGEGRG